MAKRKQGRRDNNTGAIYKDGDGYRVKILLGYDPKDGSPIHKKVRAKTHKDAVDALARLQHSDRIRPTAPPSGHTVESYVYKWLEHQIKPARAPKTYSQYKWILTMHVVPTLGKKRIDGVSRPDVQALIAALVKERVRSRAKPKTPEAIKADELKKRPLLSSRTHKLTVTVLHAMFESAIRDGIATFNPATHIELAAAPKKPPQFLSPEEVALLVQHLSGSPIETLVRFMLTTGTRIGEATGLRWKDLDLKKGVARIGGQLQRLEQKLVYRPTTKTNQDRFLALPSWLVDELREMRLGQQVNGFEDEDGIAFLNQFGRRLDPKFVNLELAKVCAKAKIPVLSAHKLRHTAATLALMETGDLHAVQKLLGHQQVALTSNLYGHATAERLRPVTSALGKFVNPQQ